MRYLFILLLSLAIAQADPMGFAWDANPPAENVTRYEVRTAARDGSAPTPWIEVEGTEATVEFDRANQRLEVRAYNGLYSEPATLAMPSIPAGLRIKVTVEIGQP